MLLLNFKIIKVIPDERDTERSCAIKLNQEFCIEY